MATLAGLPQAPSRYSPSDHPERAKDRQRYVLNRMSAVGFITPEEAKAAVNEPITVYMAKEYKAVAPFFVETLRQLLVSELGEAKVLDGGLRVYTSLDFKGQQEAQAQMREGLRELDKRQGWRGPVRRLANKQEEDAFFVETRRKLVHEKAPVRVILPTGSVKGEKTLEIFHKRDAGGAIVSNVPEYVNKGQVIDALVTKVDDAAGLVFVRSAEMQALIDVADMAWARKPDPLVSWERAGKVTKPSMVVKPGDVIRIKVAADKFTSPRLAKPAAPPKKGKNAQPAPEPAPSLASLPNFTEYAQASLEQEPLAEGALLSIDQKTEEVIAMVGGFDFRRNEFNRTIQAQRQTGSSFKAIIYASALDKGYTAATSVTDAPTVYGRSGAPTDMDDAEEDKTWKPHNYGNQFMGEVLFRTALIRSMNIPTVKILDDIGIDWATEYSRRLGIFSPLNNDLSLALGSSGVTLYEMTKVFSQFGRGGKRVRPIVVHKVVDPSGAVLLEKVSLDRRFDKEIKQLDIAFEEKRKAALANVNERAAAEAAEGDNAGALSKKHKSPFLYFDDPDQLMSPQTSYLITSILTGTSREEGGTALRAGQLGRPLAAKTGTTNGYFDTWFIGYTPQVAAAVWVGFDEEKSLGVGEAGGRTALPIWLDYMKYAHKDLPVEQFPVPSGIVFANIDNQTGKLASSQSNQVVRQAFLQGTEPKVLSGSPASKDSTDFYKEDLAD